jgi:hypothetical protein
MIYAVEEDRFQCLFISKLGREYITLFVVRRRKEAESLTNASYHD